MRIDLNPLAPLAPVPSNVVLPVADLTGRMALAMAAAELAANAGQTGSQQSDAQSHAQSQSQPQAQQRAPTANAATSAATFVRAAQVAVAEAAAQMAAAPVQDRLTLSREASLLNAAVAPPASNAAPPAPLAPAVSASTSVGPSTVPLRPSLSSTGLAPAPMPATTADLAALAAKPPAQFLLQTMAGLTGESVDQWRLLDLRADAGAVDSSYGPQASTPRAGAALNLLLQGTLRTADGQQLPFTFAAAVARGAVEAAWTPALAALLSRPALTIDYPGVAADLAGQTLHFQMALDPRNLWPLQSFLFSGLLTLGRPRRAHVEDEAWQWVWEDEDAPDDGLPKKRRKKLKPPPHDPPSELPDDGGPPIISGARWLELELRHLRSELRAWMGLPDPSV